MPAGRIRYLPGLGGNDHRECQDDDGEGRENDLHGGLLNDSLVWGLLLAEN